MMGWQRTGILFFDHISIRHVFVLPLFMLDVSTYQRESCATDLAVEDWDNKKSNPPSLILATTEFGLVELVSE